ncbi:MarR family winged helix-turn-helix transcriptional regulator [Corynebacterium sputi]|uniref:MarR family winged helix-turn-helix transcriptional regulator n=1 Tax=Corynebacterium sputi TaxID=489915 RepID=UPI00040ED6DB|nr:MarR family winged helix-turn-helix transcriptional regulator [Corynebacterium sputi]
MTENINHDSISDDNTPENPTFTDISDRLGYLTMLLRRTDMAGRGGRPFGGIRAGQGRVLGILALQSPMPQKDLAFMLGVRPQSLSELLSKLESADLVTRRRDDTDRRTFVVELTEEGRKAAEEVSNHQDDDLFAVLSDEEQDQFTTLLDRVIESAEEKFPEIRERRIAMEKRGEFPPFGGFRGGPGGRGGHHGEHHGGHHGSGHGGGPGGEHGHRGHHDGPHFQQRGEHFDCSAAGEDIRGFIAHQMRHFGFGGWGQRFA